MKQLLLMSVTLCLCSPALHSQDASESVSAKKKMSDPTGTWQWELQMNDRTINNVLKLKMDKEGQLSGTLASRDRTMKVEEGKVEEDRIRFHVQAQFNNQPVTIQFVGKIEKDKIVGEVTAKSDNGEREFPWEAKRGVDVSEVAGAWELRIETPDGIVLRPVLTIEAQDQKLSASYTSQDGEKVTVKEVQLKDGKLHFQVDTTYEGSELHVEYQGQVSGEKLEGTLEYTINGNTGELDFSGVKKK